MDRFDVQPERQNDGLAPSGSDSEALLRCPLPAKSHTPDAVTPDASSGLEEVGCPLICAVRDRLSFETLLAELSATFINLPADQVDSRIEQALKQVVEFLDIDRSGLGQLSAEPRGLVITHSYEVPGVPPSPRVILDEDLPWYAEKIHEGEILLLSRLPDDLPPEAEKERRYCLQSGLKSNLTIPLRVGGSVVGGVGFASFRGHRAWSDGLIRRLELIGEIFANAIARKRADESLRVMEISLRQTRDTLRDLAGSLLRAQETERRRIARDLHDDLNQGLSLLAVELDLLGQKPPESSAQVGRRIRELADRVRQMSSGVHTLAHALHPSRLEQLGLVAAVRGLCKEMMQGRDMPIEFSHERLPRSIPDDAVLCLYRIAQEALQNVIKHSGARRVRVVLTGNDDEVAMGIADDGVGFDPRAVGGNGGIGLVSMRERLRLVGGEMVIESRSAGGTRIDVRVPLSAGEQAPRERTEKDWQAGP